MPRIPQYARKYAVEDFQKEVRRQMGEYDLMTKKAVADAAGLDYTTLTRRLKEPGSFTLDQLAKLVKVLRLDPWPILQLAGYSKKDTKSVEKVEAGRRA